MMQCPLGTIEFRAYSVTLWGSRPGTNDDCWIGWDTETETAARVIFDDPAGTDDDYWNATAADADDEVWILIEGPGLREERQLSKHWRQQDDSWLREQAMQLGMGLGVRAYNDAMGWH